MFSVKRRREGCPGADNAFCFSHFPLGTLWKNFKNIVLGISTVYDLVELTFRKQSYISCFKKQSYIYIISHLYK